MKISDRFLKKKHFFISNVRNVTKLLLPSEPKNGTHKIITLQNRSICKQDTENLRISLSISLSLRNQIFEQRMVLTFRKSLDGFTNNFVHTFDVRFFCSEEKMSN